MKLTSVSVAMLSALYGVGIALSAHAAPNTGNANAVSIQQIDTSKTQRPRISANGPQQQAMSQAMSQTMPGGRNQQIQPASAKAKFVAEPDRTGEDVYIVRLRELPVATYDGRISGFPATSKQSISRELSAATAKTAKVNKSASRQPAQVDSAQVEQLAKSRASQYETFLLDRQDTVAQLARAEGINADIRTRYTTALNGFTMRLTQYQAKILAAMPQVEFVERSVKLQLQTDRGPAFIAADQVWAGNTVTQIAQKGEGIVVGIIDTGINSDHVAFADIGDDGYDHTNPLGEGVYLGECATGKVVCNDKLIGVYSWPVITDTYNGLAEATGEDYQGHGSHVAGTAAGNYIEDVPLLSASLDDGDGVSMGFTFPSTSGVAPHANIVSYQACDLTGCPMEAILKSYDQAIVDGVDVINFSIGGYEQFPWENAMELAMLSAREAGIMVATAAGNSGGDSFNTVFGSLGHSAPWSMVVAASTHDRKVKVTNNLISVSGGSSTPYININPGADWPDDIGGFSTTSIAGATPVLAVNYGDEMCLDAFAPGTFSSNQVVICKRGENARVAKAYNVLAGGAGGFILYNDNYSGMQQVEREIFDDTYPLPGIHVTNSVGNRLINWLKSGSDHQITLTGGSVESVIDSAAGDILADFSSLGPVLSYKHHLSPNIAAPGVSIYAPYADQHPLQPGSALSQDWAMLNGTSMASPHVAGAMALVKQAHSDWTAAEVQSALQMTASQTVRRDVDPDYLPGGHPATQHRAGSGRVDVKAAVDAGLVMDETAANFRLANPKKGGDVRQLNLPQLINSNCRAGECSWVRTVKATRDGSWTLSSDQWVYDRWVSPFDGEINMHNAKMEFFPASFSLKAGESQSIVVKANIADIQAQYNSLLSGTGNTMEGLELWTNVILTPSDTSIPAAHWPVSVNFDRMGLPEAVNMTVHRDNGGYRIAQLPLAASNDVVYRAHGPVKADTFEVTLPQDNNHQPIYSDGDYRPGHNQINLIDVPSGTSRLVVEVLDYVKGGGYNKIVGQLAGSLAIHIGRDFDGDGEANFDEEWLCSSTTQIELNYCNLTNPDAGMYWVMFSNTAFNMFDWELETGPDPDGYYGVTLEDLIDTFKVAIAVVPAGEAGLAVSGPATTDGTPVDIDLTWQLDDMVQGDIAYAGVDIGSSGAPGSTGFIPLRLERGINDVTVNVNETARGGDIIDVKVHVVQNNTGADRDFNLSTVIPDGLTLVPGSVKVSTAEQQANLTVDGSTLRIGGVQQDSTNWQRTYKVTNSDDDQTCYVPNYGRNGKGFVGLVENYNFMPSIGGTMADAEGSYEYNQETGEWTYTNPFQIQMSDYWPDNATMSLFHNQAYNSYYQFVVSPQGFVTFGPEWAASNHYLSWPFPYIMSPYGPFVAPFWRGATAGQAGFQVPIDTLGTPLEQNYADPKSSSGISIGVSGDELVIEWTNARTQGMLASWFGTSPTGEEYDDRYTFNLIMNRTYRFGDGEFEFIMAYGDMDFAGTEDFGSIGLHGHYGPLDIFGYPYDQEIGVSAAYNNLSDVVKRDKVFCYDYSGPEATQFDLSFQVRVAETAAGQTLNMDFASDVSGMADNVIVNSIKVAGNITLAAFNDVTTDENKAFDIAVAYADIDANPNLISVTGEHITAKVHGHEAGAKVTITPKTNWFGETMVTVKVADSVNSTDVTTQSFKVTVNSDGIELGCTDKAATNYNPKANQNDGSCRIAVVATKPKSGGAFAWFALLLLPLALRRRQQLTK